MARTPRTDGKRAVTILHDFHTDLPVDGAKDRSGRQGFVRGQVVTDLDAETADLWIKAGHAEPYVGEPPATEPTE